MAIRTPIPVPGIPVPGLDPQAEGGLFGSVLRGLGDVVTGNTGDSSDAARVTTRDIIKGALKGLAGATERRRLLEMLDLSARGLPAGNVGPARFLTPQLRVAEKIIGSVSRRPIPGLGG